MIRALSKMIMITAPYTNRKFYGLIIWNFKGTVYAISLSVPEQRNCSISPSFFKLESIQGMPVRYIVIINTQLHI